MRSVEPFLCAGLALLLACGGDDGGGDGSGTGGDDADAAPMADGSSAGADGGGDVSAFGLTCNPTAQDCPGDGEYLCVNIQGATNPWCTKECTTLGPAETEECGPHDGPGESRCLFSLMMEGGDTVANVCGIVCADPTGQYCAVGDCDETCPGDLQCVQASGDGVPDGFKICQ